jgi:hypothetical protein
MLLHFFAKFNLKGFASLPQSKLYTHSSTNRKECCLQAETLKRSLEYRQLADECKGRLGEGIISGS